MDAEGRPRGRGQNAGFEVIRESNKTFSKHIVSDERCLRMGVHDQAMTPTTIAVARRFNEGYRGLVGTVDASGRPSGGR
jgi:hypothetical protein